MMIDPGYARYMAAYNAEMDRRFIASAYRLTDEQRRADRGAFWKSILGTFNHILWCDHVWLARLTGTPPPPGHRHDSHLYFDDFDAMVEARTDANERFSAWAATVTQDFLSSECLWFKGRADEFRTPYSVFVAHMFNHQVHHRGQIHGLLTAFGEDPGDTGMWILARPPFDWFEAGR